MHPGLGGAVGPARRAAGRAGFTGPRTVFEGMHGLFNGFAHTRDGNWPALLDGFGERWLTPRRWPSSPIPAGP